MLALFSLSTTSLSCTDVKHVYQEAKCCEDSSKAVENSCFAAADTSALVRINAHFHQNPAFTLNHHDIQSTGFVVEDAGEQHIVTTAHGIEEAQLPPANLNMEVDHSLSYDAMGLASYPNDPVRYHRVDDGDSYTAPNDVSIGVNSGEGLIYLYVRTVVKAEKKAPIKTYTLVNPMSALGYTDVSIDQETGIAYVGGGELASSTSDGSLKNHNIGNIIVTIDLNEVAKGNPPVIKDTFGIMFDKNNPRWVDYMRGFWPDNGNGIGDIYVENGNIVTGTLQDALDWMHMKSGVSEMHNFKIDGDAKIMYVAWRRHRKVLQGAYNVHSFPHEIYKKMRSNGFRHGGVLAFDIHPDCVNNGKPCASSPKFLGLLGGNMVVPARPASEVLLSPEGTNITFDGLGCLTESTIPLNNTLPAFYRDHYACATFHDVRPHKKNNRNYVVATGTHYYDYGVHAALYPLFIFDVTNIRTEGVPLNPYIADTTEIEREPLIDPTTGKQHSALIVWHDVLIVNDIAYLNSEAFWGVAPDTPTKIFMETRLNDTARIAVIDLRTLGEPGANKFPNTGMLHVSRPVQRNDAHGEKYAGLGGNRHYIHNLNYVSANGRDYIVQAETYTGITLYDITGENRFTGPMVGFFDVNLYEDMVPSLGRASDASYASGMLYQWGTTVTKEGLIMVWGILGHHAIRIVPAMDAKTTDSILRDKNVVLPRMASPQILYGMDEETGAIHKLEVEHIDHLADVAVLKFSDGFKVSKPLQFASAVPSVVTVMSYDGSHNEVATVQRTHVSKSSRVESLVDVIKTYRQTSSNPHTKTLLHDKDSSMDSYTLASKTGATYIKRQLLGTSGFELKTTLKVGTSGAPVLDDDGKVVGMIQYYYGDKSGGSVSVMKSQYVLNAISGHTCPMVGVQGTAANLYGMKQNGFVKGSMPMPDMSTMISPVVAMPEMMSDSMLTIAQQTVDGYHIEGVIASIPAKYIGSMMTHVDNIPVGERSGHTSLADVVCASSAGSTHELTFKMLQEEVVFLDSPGPSSDDGNNVVTKTFVVSTATETECVDVTIQFTEGSWISEVVYSVVSGSNSFVVQGDATGDTTTTFCAYNSVTVTMQDTYGDTWQGGGLKIFTILKYSPPRVEKHNVTLTERPLFDSNLYFYDTIMV